jgi:putative hemolysin
MHTAETFSASSYLALGIILLVLLLLIAIISGSEVAFFSLSSEDRQMCKESESSTERRIAYHLDNPQRLLATLLIFLNLVDIIFVTLTSMITKQVLGNSAEALMGVLVQTVGVTFILVFFGELIPKVWSNQNPLRFARLTVPMVDVATTIFKPISSMLMGISNVIEKRVERKGYSITADELNHALEITAGKETTTQEKDILKGIVNFGSVSVKSIMRPRRDITAFDVELDFHELMDRINKSGYSRVPIYKETTDKIEGVLYVKDLIPYIDQDENFKWQNFIRSAFFVPESKKIDDLMYDFQEKRVHLAVVVNEYGATEGIVTMEDIIEEIVGDIKDEFDEEELEYTKLDDNTYEVEAKMNIQDLCRTLKVESDFFDEVKGESESLAGLIIELFARLPHVGEEFTYKQFTFKAISVDNRRIRRVKLSINPEFKEE